MKGEARITIAATADRLYDMVSDVTRMHEWSPETFKAEWIDGATGPAVGARFKGSNKFLFARWSTRPRVTAASRGEEFAFDTGTTRWSYRFLPQGDTTEVVESYETHGPAPFEVVNVVMRSGARLDTGMRKTLANLKQAAESAS
jgi:hypothetical protein